MAIKGLYTLVIDEHGIPTVKPVEVSGSMRIGSSYYWILPMDETPGSQEAAPPPATTNEPLPEVTIPYSAPVEEVKSPPRRGRPRIKPFSNGSEKMEQKRERALALHAQSKFSMESIARQVGVAGVTISKWIRDAGLETPADRVRRQIEEIILESGDQGVDPYTLAKIASEAGIRVGPILTDMTQKKVIKRLDNGFWAFAG